MTMIRLNSKELRKVEVSDISEHAELVVRQPIVLILENIYDTYNIGGLFRLADALAVSKVYLCGDTETPPNNRIHKASCGTYKIVPWEYCKTAKEAITDFRSRVNAGEPNKPTNMSLAENKKPSEHQSFVPPLPPTPYPLPPCVIAIEQSPISKPYTDIKPLYPLALVVGNETYGVTKETLEACDHIAEIPMWGINKSLNVIISAGIVSYHYVGSRQGSDVSSQ